MRDVGERRRFEIVHLLGKGGFGDVHLAILRAPGGFEKRVAVKVLHAEDPPPLVLERFRDEARVLGLIRDRAVVSVDPPVRLDGRWAVVMEYVDGASLGRLLKAYRTLPPTVALEIVQEVCRVLDKGWSVRGPEGRPLHLMHRDLKPANLQITRAGEVKLLDFGLAKGDYDAREAETTNQLSGTAGYIAPERFLGQDGDRSDVFSMGVVLWRCLLGRAPEVADLTRLKDGGTQEDPALLLAARMLAHDPAHRPTPLEVEEQARALRRQLRWPGSPGVGSPERAGGGAARGPPRWPGPPRRHQQQGPGAQLELGGGDGGRRGSGRRGAGRLGALGRRGGCRGGGRSGRRGRRRGLVGPGDGARRRGSGALDRPGLEAGEADDPGRLGDLVGHEARHPDHSDQGGADAGGCDHPRLQRVHRGLGSGHHQDDLEDGDRQHAREPQDLQGAYFGHGPP